MKYVNVITGQTIETDARVSGNGWEPVAEKKSEPKKKGAEKK